MVESSSAAAPKLYTVREIASILKVHPSCVRAAIHAHKLGASLVGDGFRIEQSALRAYLRSARTCGVSFRDPRRNPEWRGGKAKP